MTLVSTPWHVFSASIVFILGALGAARSARHFNVPDRHALILYLWHTLFCFVYLYYTISNAADAITYFRESLTYSGGATPGSPFVYFFTSIFSKWMGFSYVGVFLVFNIIGFYGLLAVYGAFRSATEGKSRRMRQLALLLALLPSASFWSSAVGKDAISFMAIGFALWAALDFRRRYVFMMVAVSSMFFVRPHMATLMICALSISLVFSLNASVLQRIVLGGAVLMLAAVVVPFAMRYAGLGEATGADDIADYMERRQSYNMSGGGAVDISSMSPPTKLLTYLLRPLPHEAHSIPALAASLDNVVLTLLLLFGAMKLWAGRKLLVPGNRVFLWIYVLAAWFVLAMTTANLGISVRQKWMFLPALMFLLLSYLGSDPKSRSVR